MISFHGAAQDGDQVFDDQDAWDLIEDMTPPRPSSCWNITGRCRYATPSCGPTGSGSAMASSARSTSSRSGWCRRKKRSSCTTSRPSPYRRPGKCGRPRRLRRCDAVTQAGQPIGPGRPATGRLTAAPHGTSSRAGHRRRGNRPRARRQRRGAARRCRFRRPPCRPALLHLYRLAHDPTLHRRCPVAPSAVDHPH